MIFRNSDIVVLLCVAIIGLHSCLGSPRLTLKQGNLQGSLKKSYEGKTYSAFVGIPYAKPPLGELRFQHPVAAPNWKGTLRANKYYTCSQLGADRTIFGTEDCLYVNVYVPKEKIDKNDNLDVVVHIHGGPWVGLYVGSPEDMALPDYIIDKNVIVVTFNYRIGAQGFLTTGDDHIPGNLGFKDQVLALKWIKNNIKEFGGNPNSVTLTGFSGGGASVQFHYLSPLSKGLFHKGISTSYQVTNPGSLSINPLEKTKQLAKILQCPTKPVASMAECLKKTPIDRLVNTTIWFKPTVEKGVKGAFLPEVPYKLLKDKKVHDVPWVASNVIDEDMYSLASVYNNRDEIFTICRNWKQWGLSWLDLADYVDKDKIDAVLNPLKKFYLNDCKITAANGLEKLNNVMNDRHFFVGSDLSLRTQPKATKSHVYYYISKYVPQDKLQLSGPPVASHGTDSRLIFKFKNNPAKLKPQDEKMMRVLTQFVADYAKTGVPKIGNTKWLPIDPNDSSLNILEIDSPDKTKMIKKKELAPMKLWTSLPIKENQNLI